MSRCTAQLYEHGIKLRCIKTAQKASLKTKIILYQTWVWTTCSVSSMSGACSARRSTASMISTKGRPVRFLCSAAASCRALAALQFQALSVPSACAIQPHDSTSSYAKVRLLYAGELFAFSFSQDKTRQTRQIC